MSSIKETFVKDKPKCPVCKSRMDTKDEIYICPWCNIRIDPRKVTVEDVICQRTISPRLGWRND